MQPRSKFNLTISCLALLAFPCNAATREDCLAQFKTADVNANGALTTDEDKNGFITAAIKGGKPLLRPNTLSRDEFVQFCTENLFSGVQAGEPSTNAGPAASRDTGKGDITPGENPLSEADARKKIEASGFREIQNLKLGSDGVWRASAVANGQRQVVAIDPQGDMVGKPSEAPGTAAKATVPPTSRSDSLTTGHGGSGGLVLWVFLLVGNAIGLLALSSITGGGTSAMSTRTENPFV